MSDLGEVKDGEEFAEGDPDYQKQLEDAPPSMSESPHTPDEPVEVPPVEAPVAGEVIDEGDEPVDESTDTKWDEHTVDELKVYADEYHLDVTRGDGQEGDPLKEDYVAALEKWEAEQPEQPE